MKILKIGTFNIQHGKDHVYYLETKKERIDFPLMASVIRAEELDICALNEVREESETPVGIDQAKEIAACLGYHYVFGKAIDFRGGAYGNAIVSRYPITRTRLHPIAIPKDQRLHEHSYYEDRVLLEADISVDGEILTLFACHFGLAPDEQEQAVKIIRAAQAETKTPIVLLGDFNVTPVTDIYRDLSETFTDAADGTRDDFTFPSHAPSRKIDYIFTSGACRSADFRVSAHVASDHRAVLTTLTFPV